MPSEQPGQLPATLRRPTGLDTWLLQPHAGGNSQAPVPSASDGQHRDIHGLHPAEDDDDDEQDAVSRQLLNHVSQHWSPPAPPVPAPASAPGSSTIAQKSCPQSTFHAAPVTTNGGTGPPIAPSSSILPPLRNRQYHVVPPTRPTVAASMQIRPQPFMPSASQSQQIPQTLADRSRNAPTERDELAGSDSEDPDAPLLPLVMSDLDPRYQRQTGAADEPSPKSPENASIPSLRRPPQTAQKDENSNSNRSNSNNMTGTAVQPTPLRQPVISIPLSATPPSLHRTSAAAVQSPMSVSISIPSYSPKGHRTAAKGAPSSPVVELGKRTGPPTGMPAKDGRLKGGRPKGWKPGMSYREVALRNMGYKDDEIPTLLFSRQKKRIRPAADWWEGEDAQKRGPGRPRLPTKLKPNYVLARRPGRPSLASIESVQRSIFLNSQACFIPFVCEWAGCRAELQNMATLRKHVMVVHGRSATTCRWRRCADKVPPVAFGITGANGGTGDENKENGDGDRNKTFEEHMEYYHLQPLVWQLGDGFANNSHLGPQRPLVPPLMKAKASSVPTLKAEINETGTPESQTDGSGADAGPDTDNTENAPAQSSSSSHGSYAALDIPPEQLPRYLLDDQGKQVTPLIRDPLLEPAALSQTPEDRARRLKELYRQQQYVLNKRPDRNWSRLL
ncbi:hypothetical protein SPI_01014 [Niveomyces insectorum RCEF 264]|uniref:C2H2-type domain-containing protein n=1 Tax=Niveomyces insectorum RCEF 264 TaxID=1081102 RepID=A0A167YLC6_9HYPO|nr:hypothetical protein SPI_01014 [Niveomyces insectorum RCEF 264]